MNVYQPHKRQLWVPGILKPGINWVQNVDLFWGKKRVALSLGIASVIQLYNIWTQFFKVFNCQTSQAWELMPEIPGLRRLTQENLVF
jgi:hypothetical protein